MSKKKTENNNSYDKKLAFKNNASFISCISKINNAFIGVAENLDVAMSIIIYLNPVKIIKRQQVYETIIEVN